MQSTPRSSDRLSRVGLCVAVLGVAVSCMSGVPARAVTIDWVTVGDPGNAADTTGYGAVGYSYQLGKYEVTIQQYADFLNAVAATDTYSLYNTQMGNVVTVAGISRAGSSGSYTYSVVAPSGTTPVGASSPGNRPIAYVSWFDAARFANWMHNGQGSGSTETGAYAISTGQITAASRTGGVNTYTLAAPSTLLVGDQVVVSGLVGTAFNVRGVVTTVSGSQFTMANTNSDATATGTGSMTGAPATAATTATYSIPTDNEWFKAAYYSPLLTSGSGGYWTYATQSNTAPGNTIGSGANQANYKSNGLFSVTQSSNFLLSTQNYLTDVSAFTNSASYYGTFDQNGNVAEWNEVITGTASGSPGASRGVRGGNWYAAVGTLSSGTLSTANPFSENDGTGFRLARPVSVPEPTTCALALAGLACGGFSMWRRRKRSRSGGAAPWAPALAAVLLCSTNAHAVTIDWVTVGDPGNPNDTINTGTTPNYGSVATSFQIMKYEFTNQQYADFLNSVAATDTYLLYNASMGSSARGGITQSGASGSYTYAAKTNMGDKPVNYVSWFDVARVSNWLMNGATGTSSTETGAYTLAGATSGTAPTVNPGATHFIPTENQWYKAAYYKGGSTNAGYWTYATQSNSAPTAVTAGATGIGSAGSAGNFANYNYAASWNSQGGNVTTVGTNGGPSAYGAFDMSGNVSEWNDGTADNGWTPGRRGGPFGGFLSSLSSAVSFTGDQAGSNETRGFRLAAPAAVPEPSTYCMALAGLACGGFSMWRRRKRA